MSQNMIFFLFFILASGCSSSKNELSDVELKKLVEKVAYHRFIYNLNKEDGMLPKSDKEIFLEICKMFRIDSNMVLLKIKQTYPDIYPAIEQGKL